MATEGIAATGYSICYELGIFKQKIEDGRQTETADNWKSSAESWLIPRYEDTVEIRFGGRVEENWDYFGNCHAELKAPVSLNLRSSSCWIFSQIA